MFVGVLGAGQLGRMLALAGYPLGLRFRFLDPAAEAPAEQLADRVVGAYEDLEAMNQFVADLDVATFEFENVPVTTAQFLAQRVPVYPPPLALEVGQDRVSEKTFFQKAGIPTPAFAAVETKQQLTKAIDTVGLPAVLKTRRFGYDGKGQMVLRQAEDAVHAWEALGGVPLILEAFVPFQRELSVLAVRSRNGQTVFYPLVENHHRDGMLRLSLAPAPHLTRKLQSLAETHANHVLDALGYVGCLAIEFFQQDGELLANEMAPRVHNSGHWTIEGAETSQFENHLRAILGLPLGDPSARAPCAMVNLIGTIPEREAVLTVPGAHLHLYGKSPRPGRKLGHITLLAPDAPALQQRLKMLGQ